MNPIRNHHHRYGWPSKVATYDSMIQQLEQSIEQIEESALYIRDNDFYEIAQELRNLAKTKFQKMQVYER